MSTGRLQTRAVLSLALFFVGCASAAKTTASPTEKARMLVEVANGALVEGDPTGALTQLFLAEKWDDSLPELHHSKALAFLAKHDPEAAVTSARRAVALKDDYSDANTTLGKLLLDGQKYGESERFLLRAAKDPLYRGSFRAQTNLGILYYRTGDFPKSLEQLNRAIEAAPTASCVAYYYRGHLKLRESRFGDAIKDYRLATEKLCGGLVEAHFALGVAYDRAKQYDLARKKFLEVKQNFPDSAYAGQAMERLRGLP